MKDSKGCSRGDVVKLPGADAAADCTRPDEDAEASMGCRRTNPDVAVGGVWPAAGAEASLGC